MSMQQLTSPADMSALIKDIRQDAKVERDELESKHKAEMQRQIAEMEDRHKAEMDTLRAELTPAPAQELVSAEQLAALQARLEQLHAAQLLTDEELFALEDICVDYIALGLVTAEMAGGNAAASKLLQLVRVSEGVATDASFARQAKRRFV